MRQRRPARDRDEWEVAGPAGVTSPAQRGVARLWPLPPPPHLPTNPQAKASWLWSIQNPGPRVWPRPWVTSGHPHPSRKNNAGVGTPLDTG